MENTLTFENPAAIEAERRSLDQNRRQHLYRSALHSMVRNRRRNTRRASDTLKGTYVDVHDPLVIIMAIGAVMLSTLDAFFTTKLLFHGNEELNPIMAMAIDTNIYLFLLTKFMLTGAGVVVLVMHRYHLLFNKISGFQLLAICFIGYFILVAYEFSMVVHLPFILH